MIDHVAARRLAATATDVPLDTAQIAQLDQHLATCPACRAVSSALARDAAALRHLDLGPVPISVRANVAIAAEHGRGGRVGRWFGLVAVGALLVLALGAGALSGVGGRARTAQNDAAIPLNPVRWQGDGAEVQASDFWIEVGAGRFGGTAAQPHIRVKAEPGSRVLDVAWGDNGASVGNLRVFLVDLAGSWWVKGVQVSNSATGDWFDAQGTLVGTSIENRELGDVDLELLDATRAPVRVVGHVHLGSLVIKLAPPASDTDGLAPVPPVGTQVPPVPVATGAAG